MMKGESGYHDIKRAIQKRKIFGISFYKRDVADLVILAFLFSDFQHSRRGIQTDNMTRMRSKAAAAYAGSSGDVKDDIGFFRSSFANRIL